MVRSLVLIAGLAVVALVVAHTSLTWWPNLLQTVRGMHGMR